MGQIKAKNLSGSMVALVTPMSPDGQINFDQWQQLIKMHLKAGTDGIIVGGTTGESALLTTTEMHALIESAVSLCQGHDTLVIVGTGTIDPNKVKQANKQAANLGADAALVVTPYYLLLSQQALYNHFKAIADDAPLPIILYNVPNRTGIDISSETTAKLAKLDAIIGIKEAKSDMTRIEKLLKNKDFSVLSGDDHSFVAAMTKGAHGVISVAANVIPKTIKELCTLVQLGNINNAEKMNDEIKPLCDFLFHEPNPCPLKSIMHAAELIDSGIRAPLVLTEIKPNELKRQLKTIETELNTL
ncbi:4-hydroxy-tetrahydrodipicolinate synthase [Marinicella sp. S1101]|uniref:4-hydroxy-tetrahydrodipicolinate synthase n=1 Tax=Marinicella marina TaxID=2996016 RepID=UPI0022608ED5|nr:4-hydroxy-tetrahydrodipicolinate synthase [Marinicella marina]MCX7554965.1 4-hydroxy-tetrahydrodipicolinate synthase [Marinicella marina]MDJ1141575.1 4-hydroxy-tetrahydrodipicolinate synthase [Marinicella marina]